MELLILSTLGLRPQNTRARPHAHSPSVLTTSLLALWLSACHAPEPPESAFSPQESASTNGGETAGGEQLSAGAEAQEPTYQERFNGTWAHYSQISTCVDIGSSLEQLNRSLYRVKVEELEHGGMIEEWEACEIDLTPVISVRAQVPEALRQSVYPMETRRGQVVGAPPLRHYMSGPMVELWGVRMDEPSVDPMPADAADDRIYDMDEDGEPAVTLKLGDTCQAYMVQRRVNSYYGALIEPGLIEGEALSVTEQLIIDASSPLCKTSYQTRSHPSRSHFRRARVDGTGGSLNLDQDGDGDVTCAELMMGRDLLFSQHFETQEVDDESCRL